MYTGLLFVAIPADQRPPAQVVHIKRGASARKQTAAVDVAHSKIDARTLDESNANMLASTEQTHEKNKSKTDKTWEFTL